jgi:hypothetical protein
MRIHRFTIISGIGWLLDLSTMGALVHGGLSVFLANLIGATLGITFVFFAAQNRIFVNEGGFLYRKLGTYVLFQSLAVPAASLAIHVLRDALHVALPPFTALDLAPEMQTLVIALAAKVLVTPATLYGNFLFMGWLLERRLSYW